MISFIRMIDTYIGNLILFLLPQNKKLNNGKNILIIRLWTLGESLLTLPMIKKLKEEGYNINILVTDRSKSVFENVNFIDDIINLKNIFSIIKNLNKYDIAIDTEPYLKISSIISWWLSKFSIGWDNRKYSINLKYNDKIHTVNNFCRLIEPLNIKYEPKELIPLNYKNENKIKVNDLIKDIKNQNKKIIGIHAGMAESSPWRSWKNFPELINNLNEKYNIILTGSNEEKKINKSIILTLNNINNISDFSGNTNLLDLSYLLTQIDLFISNDTGPMHLSAAMKCKTIGLFGPNLPERFGLYGENNISIYEGKKLGCSPCINVHKGSFPNCPINGKCMDLIKVNDVLKKIEEALS